MAWSHPAQGIKWKDRGHVTSLVTVAQAPNVCRLMSWLASYCLLVTACVRVWTLGLR